MPVSERPNILFCVFDSLSIHDSGLLKKSNELPTLTRLRESSTLFTRTYTPCPESSPARASLFTGLDPCVHGLWTNGITLPNTEWTFPQRLSAAGYTNCLVGRRQLAGVSEWTTEQVPKCEFTHAEWAHGPLHRSRQNAYLVWLQQTAPEHYSTLFSTQANPDDTQATQEQHEALAKLPDELSFNHWVCKRLNNWITSHPTGLPFLAVAGFSIGSLSGAAPTAKHDSEAVNRQALQQADAALGLLLDQLSESNRDSETIVIITASRGNNVQSTDSLMSERALSVPLLIHRSGYGKQHIDAPVSTMDVTPTILALSSTPIGPRMQGTSLLGILNGTESPRGWAMSRLRRGCKPQEQGWQTAFCTADMKLVMLHGSTRDATPATFKLFDLKADPQENQNLAAQESYAAELEAMIDLMIDARCALEDRTEPRIAEF